MIELHIANIGCNGNALQYRALTNFGFIRNGEMVSAM